LTHANASSGYAGDARTIPARRNHGTHQIPELVSAEHLRAATFVASAVLVTVSTTDATLTSRTDDEGALAPVVLINCSLSDNGYQLFFHPLPRRVSGVGESHDQMVC
jgi:hypothetical protein